MQKKSNLLKKLVVILGFIAWMLITCSIFYFGFVAKNRQVFGGYIVIGMAVIGSIQLYLFIDLFLKRNDQSALIELRFPYYVQAIQGISLVLVGSITPNLTPMPIYSSCFWFHLG